MEGLYTGAELSARSSRPGAYDAMKIPSLVNGRKRMPDAPGPTTGECIPPAPRVTVRAHVVISDAEHTITQPEPISSAVGPVANALPVVQRLPDYRPRAGSATFRALEALRGMPQHSYLTPNWAHRHLGVHPSCFHPIFKAAVDKKALVRAVIGRRAALALPGFDPAYAVLAEELEAVSGKPTEDSPTGDAYLDPSLQDALTDLRLREAEAHAWQAYVDLLQLRARMSRVARSLPFPPLTEPPRLAGVA